MSYAHTSGGGNPGTQKWGRVLIAGGTDWPKLGRKERGGRTEDADHPDLLEPHILRSLSNVKAVGVHTSCAGCHTIVLDTEGTAWMFGRNQPAALGVPGVDAISENAPRPLRATDLGALPGTTFVNAACGRSHSVLVGSNGRVWTAGLNSLGQCGHPPCPEVSTFKLVNGPLHPETGEQEHVIAAAAGITFTLFLTVRGKIYASGSGEKGQLGNGRTGEHIATGNRTGFDIESEPIPVKGLDDKQIVQIACGQQHSIALDEDGIVYVWGYNGYCRLGLGNQKDVLTPQVVPQFAGPHKQFLGSKVAAGPSSSVVFDRQGMYYVAGKWKNTGDGSAGQPYSTFRLMQDIMGCKMKHACSGGVTHFALAPDEEEGGVMTIAWGQNAANGELGLGPEEPKSATKPTRNQPLIGIDVFDVTAGQNTTFFLVTPNEKYSDLPRHPVELDTPDECMICRKDHGDPLACDKCDKPYHLTCLTPPLAAIPDGEWFCPECVRHPGAPIGSDAASAAAASYAPPAGASSRKKGARYRDEPPEDDSEQAIEGDDDDEEEEEEDEDDDDEDEDDDDEDVGRKRKAPAKRSTGPSQRA
ncbi:regulator of chromosome condensation 1/beta-lactamase-inhibitor protein II [Russula compacta]|nr:regulator of chromosome condensation 1/beta-lactamase-inhibitor protein II [Russula compacta]